LPAMCLFKIDWPNLVAGGSIALFLYEYKNAQDRAQNDRA